MTERLQGPTPAGVGLREVSVKRELPVAENRFLPPEDPQATERRILKHIDNLHIMINNNCVFFLRLS